MSGTGYGIYELVILQAHIITLQVLKPAVGAFFVAGRGATALVAAVLITATSSSLHGATTTLASVFLGLKIDYRGEIMCALQFHGVNLYTFTLLPC